MTDIRPQVNDGGIFGRWIRDEAGLPAFSYELDHVRDPRGEWDTRIFGTSRLQWHQLGNDRLVAIATNDGWVQLYSHENGPRWINEHRPEEEALAGGISYLLDVERADQWSTLYRELPEGAEVMRIFGCGYFRFTVQLHDVELDRIVFAPFGDGRLLASLIRISNRSQRTRHLRHGEYWGVRLSNIDFAIASGMRLHHDRRDDSSAFTYDGYGARWDDELGGLLARHPRGPLSYDMPYFVGPTPRTRPDVICVPIGTPTDGWTATRQSLFGGGGVGRPDAMGNPPHEELSPGGEGQRAAFLLTSDLQLAPGETETLSFVYGAVPPLETSQEVALAGEDVGVLFESTRLAWREALPHVDLDGTEWLGRELAWGAYYLRSGATYHEGFRAHTLSQGGAYQYLGGFNAGPRATVQHALPLVWLAPELAAEAARFTMAEATPDGELAYSEVGAGLWEPLNYCPSDNDLWLLWLVSEYVLATRDAAFLRQSVSYWPAPYTRPEPVWEHCLRAYEHLLDVVGTGPHGLIKLRLGDWNDVIVAESDVPVDRVWEEGESTLNTAMAVHVLRRFAELARYAGEPETAELADSQAEVFADAVRACWRDTHLNRGWADPDHEVGHKDLFLEPQPWALIGGLLDEDQAGTLVREIRDRCEDPLATRIFGPGGEGCRPTAGGGQWLSINSTLVWGLGTVDRQEAWRELQDNTLHKHALVYPEIWFGVWSGPDTYLPPDFGFEAFAGQTWFWPGIFSMQAWPVQILFAHSEPLNASLWLSGIVPTARGLRVDPMLPFEGWTWDGGLVALHFGPDEIRGELGALASEVVEIDAKLPSGLQREKPKVVVGDTEVDRVVEDRRVRFRLPVGPGRRTPFRVYH